MAWAGSFATRTPSWLSSWSNSCSVSRPVTANRLPSMATRLTMSFAVSAGSNCWRASWSSSAVRRRPLTLPDWTGSSAFWPLPQPSMASAFAAVEPPHHSHRFSGDWWKDNERRAAAQRAEQQRIADYYARTTKEQEDRENAEARECFLEQQQRLSVNRPPRP